jgi:hypothetical protein
MCLHYKKQYWQLLQLATAVALSYVAVTPAAVFTLVSNVRYAYRILKFRKVWSSFYQSC